MNRLVLVILVKEALRGVLAVLIVLEDNVDRRDIRHSDLEGGKRHKDFLRRLDLNAVELGSS